MTAREPSGGIARSGGCSERTPSCIRATVGCKLRGTCLRIGSVVITGGAGFIGRQLVGHCLRKGWRVSVVDNLCAGKLKNLEEFAGIFAFSDTDILDAMTLRRVMEEAEPELVFHLAAHHFIPFCNAHPQDTLRVNVEGTHVVLSEAARVGTHRAVLASSGSIYPSRTEPLTEDIEPAPVDVYGLSKLLMEEVAKFISATSEMACTSVRLFNVYGPYETNPHLIPDIVANLRNGSTVHLGNVHTKRDYIYVEDVAELLCLCATTARDQYSVINLGTGREYSASEILDVLSELLSRKLNIEIDETRKRAVDKLHQRADTQRLEVVTGQRPSISLDAGLRRLLEHERILS